MSKKYLPQHPVTARRRAMERKHRLSVQRRRKIKRRGLFSRRRRSVVVVVVVVVVVFVVISISIRHLFRRLRFCRRREGGGGGSLFCKRHAHALTERILTNN